VIKYLGSKRTLVPRIAQVMGVLAQHASACSVIDLFSGTSRVGHALKAHGFQVHSNDHNAYATTLARCYVQADRESIERDAFTLIAELNALPGAAGYFTETFCEKSRFFHPKNGARVDAMREVIAAKHLDPELEAVLLVSLMEAADRVDSTTGVQMAYLKQWAARASNDIQLRMPDVLPRAKNGKGSAHQLDAADAVATLRADVAYLDPPYNQHKYLGNYHIWESLVLWDKPEVYGIACKRIDCKERDSAFNSRPRSLASLTHVIKNVQAKHLVVSFNNEGYFDRETMESLLRTRGEVVVIETDFKRYVGAQIGIYNPSGEKVGAVSHLRNKEYLYVATRDAAVLNALRAQSEPRGVRKAASATPISSRLTDTAQQELPAEGLLHVVAEWEGQHGEISKAELAATARKRRARRR
jgi:adenine-specific DNA-methyltransferase